MACGSNSVDNSKWSYFLQLESLDAQHRQQPASSFAYSQGARKRSFICGCKFSAIDIILYFELAAVVIATREQGTLRFPKTSGDPHDSSFDFAKKKKSTTVSLEAGLKEFPLKADMTLSPVWLQSRH